MRKVLIGIILAVSLVCAVQVVSADSEISGWCGENVEYTFNENTGTLTISGKGTMFDFKRPWLDYVNKITHVIIENGVTSVGMRAFADCTVLEDVKIPDSVTNIETSAFERCVSLQQVVLPNSVKCIGWSAFKNCTGLTKIEIPNSVTHIESYAFAGCSSLQTIVIPDIAINIAANVFSNTEYYNNEENWANFDEGSILYINNHIIGAKGSLHTGSIWDGIVTIASSAFSGCNITSVEIPDSVKVIGDCAFENCTNLTEINISDASLINIGMSPFLNSGYSKNEENWDGDLLYIGSYLMEVNKAISGTCNIKDGTINAARYAFWGCSGLTEVTIPSSFKSIPHGMFASCSNLKNIDIPFSVTKVEEQAFFYCKGLENIEIPPAVTQIEVSAFYGCTSLKSIDIPPSISTIANSTFYGCSSLIEISIPDSVKIIDKHAFRECTNLESVNLPKELISIGEYAFADCTSLKEMKIPENVKNIADYTFINCTGLDSIIIHAGIIYIGDNAFNTCTSLVNVYYGSDITDWNNISIGIYNDVLKTAKIHYNSQGECKLQYELTDKALVVIPENISAKSVIAVSGNKEQAIVIYFKEYTGEGSVEFSLGSDTDNIKVFVWESFETMKPLMDALEVK